MNQLLFLINQLLPVSFAIDERRSSDEVASKLGKHPFFVKKLMETLNKNPMRKKLPKSIILLAALDKQIKSGKITGKQAIIQFSNAIKHQI